MKLTDKNLYKADAIPARIALLHKNGIRLQDEMHKLACSVLLHVGTTKDIRVIHQFIAAMPDMARTNGLRAWFEAFGPVKFTEVDGLEQITFIKPGTIKLGEAIAKPFYKFSANEGKPYVALDLTAYTEQVIKKLQKDADETGRDMTPMIEAIKAARAVLVPRPPVAVPASQATVDAVDVLAN